MSDTTRAVPKQPMMVGVDALGGRAWCLSCARLKKLLIGVNDDFGEPIQPITTADEFVEVMDCCRCGRFLMPNWLIHKLEREAARDQKS